MVPADHWHRRGRVRSVAGGGLLGGTDSPWRGCGRFRYRREADDSANRRITSRAAGSRQRHRRMNTMIDYGSTSQLTAPQSDESDPKASKVPKHISDSVRAARLQAAQELLELADEEVGDYEFSYRMEENREYKTLMFAYLN